LRFSRKVPPKIKKKLASAKAVLFVREFKVLLLQKPNGHWDLPGGKLKAGEGWVDGLAREIFEESGLRIKNAEWIAGWSNDNGQNKPSLTGLFVCRLDCRPKKSRIVISDEHVKGKFFSLKKTKRLAMPKAYAAAIGMAAQKIGA